VYATQNPDPTQQMPAGTPVPPKVPAAPPVPQAPVDPEAKKKAGIDILKNLVAGRPPIGTPPNQKTAGFAPPPGTAAHAGVQTAEDPTKDPNNSYYGVDPESLASYKAAQTQSDQYAQALQGDTNTQQPTAPSYQAPTEDHVGRRNTAQIGAALLGLLLGPGRHGSGAGNFLGALSGGMGQGRQQLMQNKTATAKEKFQASEDAYKTQVQQNEKKQTGDIALENHAESNVDRIRGQIEAQHKNAVEARQKQVDHQAQMDEWAEKNKVEKGRFNLDVQRFKFTQKNDEQTQAYRGLTIQNNALHQHTMEGIAMTNSQLHAESIALQRKGLEFRESHEHTPESQAEKEKIRTQGRQITMDQSVLEKLPNQLKDKVTEAHKRIFGGANATMPDGVTPKENDPALKAQFNAAVQAIYADGRKTLEPIHTRMRANGIDTSGLDSEEQNQENEDDKEYGIPTDPSEEDGTTVTTTGFAPVPKNYPAAQGKPAAPQAHQNTPPPAAAAQSQPSTQKHNNKTYYLHPDGNYYLAPP
jgi:hypothetical protein